MCGRARPPGARKPLIGFEETARPAVAPYQQMNYTCKHLLVGVAALLWAAGGAAQTNALPDLIMWGPAAANYIITNITFIATNCAVVEGCVQAGDRRIIRFTGETRNIGLADLVMGSPTNNPLFEFSPCHGHYHFHDYAEYRLVTTNGQQAAVGLKAGFCLLDSFRWDPSAFPTRVYDCEFQGLQKGWADSYPGTLDCQWIDITDTQPGSYQLELESNPQHVLQESDYSNNVASIQVVIPPCATISPTNFNASAVGVTNVVQVFGTSYCHWTTTNNESWITILSANNGIATGMVNYAIADNYSTNSRTGTFDVAGRAVTVAQAAAIDTDGDGMPDNWESTYDLNPGDAGDAQLDADGDGFSNAQEFVARTNPKDAASALRIVAVDLNGVNPGISFTSVTGRFYRLTRSDDLMGGNWSIVTNNVPGNGGVVQLPVSDPSPPPGRYYRVEVLP